jgi:hypothetical protein
MNNYQQHSVEKRLDGTYVVIHDGHPYQVCTKEVDPDGIYDIAEVAEFWGSLPKGDPRKQVEVPPPQPTPEDIAAIRKAEIYARLDEIDRVSIRPLRAIAEGTATEDDHALLAALEVEAVKLRKELQNL